MTRPFNACATLALLFAMHCLAPARAGEVVVVAAKSSVGAMTPEQVSQLFLGKSPTLPGGQSAVLIDQAEGSAARDGFYAKLAGKNAAQMKALWSRLTFSGTAQPPKAVGGDAEVKRAVAETPGAVGYIDKGALDGSVKVVLAVD
jgi:ABC-type phosphate transport system substrate-binding protein